MTLKEAMEKIWNRPGVMFPNHRCQFHQGPHGYEILKGILHVQAGGAVFRYRSKKKGYSFLPKNYGFYWLNSNKQHFPRCPGTREQK